MVKAISEFILLTVCFTVWCFLWFCAIPVAFAEASDILTNNDDTERGSYYKNWHTANVLPDPLATLVPLEPIPTVDPSEQDDEGGEGAAGVSNNRGISFIGQMCSANAKTQRKFWNEAYKNSTTWNAGWLYGQTFNQTGCQWSKAFMEMPHPKRVRIHICNCTCFKDRHRTCTANECFPGMTTAQANAAVASDNSHYIKTMNKIINKAITDARAAGNTLIDFAVSPCLESGLTAANRKKMMQKVVAGFATYNAERTAQGLNPIRFVDNPLSDTCLKNRFCEKHGFVKRGAKGIADTDGLSYDNIAQATYGGNNAGAWMVLAWKDCFNGLKPDATFVNPVSRTDWCSQNRDAANLAHFTDDAFQATPSSSTYAQVDLKGCTSFRQIDSASFVWKLGEGRNFTTWVTPPNTPRFEQLWLMKNGKKIDYAGGGIHRMGTQYHNEPRQVYDFQYPLQNYPDNVVMHGKVKGSSGEICWKFPKPSFRPFNNPNRTHQN